MRKVSLLARSAQSSSQRESRRCAEGMLGVAADGLGGLGPVVPGRSAAPGLESGRFEPELTPGRVDGAVVTVAGDLGVDPVEGFPGAHERGDADDGLVAEHADLDLRSVAEGGGHGCHAGFEEVEVLDGVLGIFDLMP